MLILSVFHCSRKIYEMLWTIFLLRQINFPNDSMALEEFLSFVFTAHPSVSCPVCYQVEIILEKASLSMIWVRGSSALSVSL